MDAERLAANLYSKGFEPIPIRPGTKVCYMEGWSTMALPVTPWPKHHGIGIRTGPQVGIDFDIYDAALVEGLLDVFRQDYAFTTRVGQPPKVLVPVLCPEITEKFTSRRYRDTDGKINAIEVLSHGQQFVAYGIHPDTKKPYSWSTPLLHSFLPVLEKSYLDALIRIFEECAEGRGWECLQLADNVSKSPPGRFTTGNDNIISGGSEQGNSQSYTLNRPGDLFNAAHGITELLVAYGWKHYHGNKWTRPGKSVKAGSSATVTDDAVLYNFSDSVPELKHNESYSPFALYTMYEFGGDFTRSAQAVKSALRQP